MSATRDYRLSHIGRGRDYDSLSRNGWARYMTDRERDILAKLVSSLFPRRIPRHLDFACGTGRVTEFLEEMADQAYGVDVSATMIEQAQRKCSRTKFIHADLTIEDLELEPVHLISAFRFFGNAQDRLRISALHAIRQLLVPRGYLVFNNHKNASSMHNLLRTCVGDRPSEDLSYSKLRRMLASTGFRIRRTCGVGFWLFRSKWKREDVLDSRTAKMLEPISRFPLAAPFCPDIVVLAQRFNN